MTLNAGFSTARGNKMSDEDRDLIQEFIRLKGVTKVATGKTTDPAVAFNSYKGGKKKKVAE